MNRLLLASVAIGLEFLPSCHNNKQDTTADCPPAFTDVEDPYAVVDGYCAEGKTVPCHERTNTEGREALRMLTAEGVSSILMVDPYHEDNGGNLVCLDGKTYIPSKGKDGGLLLIPTRDSNTSAIAVDGDSQTPVERNDMAHLFPGFEGH